jgi:hypothetical protein
MKTATRAKPRTSSPRPRAARGIRKRAHAPKFSMSLPSTPKALPAGAAVLIFAAVALLAAFHTARERLHPTPHFETHAAAPENPFGH